MYINLTDIPEAIQEYYHTEVVSIPLVDEEGNLVYDKEPYDYQDAYDNTRVGSKLIQVYEDVERYILNDRTDLMTWTHVSSVINSEAIFEYVVYCINKAVEREKWGFFDTYIEWQAIAPDSSNTKYLEVDEDNSPLYSYAADMVSWAANEPTPYITDANLKIAEYNADKAIQSRYNYIYAKLWVELSSGTEGYVDIGAGKDGVLGIDNIKDAVMANTVGAPEDTPVQWIMSDNSVVAVTLADLGNILMQFNLRKQSIFNSYSLWRSSDKLTPFVL